MSVFHAIMIHLVKSTTVLQKTCPLIWLDDEPSLKMLKELVYKNITLKRKPRTKPLDMDSYKRYKFYYYLSHIDECLYEICLKKELIKNKDLTIAFFDHLSVYEDDEGKRTPILFKINNMVFLTREVASADFSDNQYNYYFYNYMFFLNESEDPRLFSYFFYFDTEKDEIKDNVLIKRAVNPLYFLRPHLRSSSFGFFFFISYLPSPFITELSTFYSKLLITYNRKRKKPENQSVYEYLTSFNDFFNSS